MAALGAGNFDELLGTPESAWVDFKQEPYLPFDNKKAEFAKDVAQFANGSGGLLVIGFETEEQASAAIEAVTRHRPVRKTLVDVGQYRDVIQSWIVPHVRSIRFHWFPSDHQIPEGVLVIEIPPQDEAEKYFIVRRVEDAEGKPADAVGVPLREEDRAVWLSADRLYDLIRDGLRYRRTPPTPPALSLVSWDEVVDELDQREPWIDQPVLYLQASPTDPINVDVYRRNDLLALIAEPPALRRSGFGLRTYGGSKVQGEALTAEGNRKLLRLESNGLITAAASGGFEFLAWAINDRVPLVDGRIRINSIVLCEFVLEFCIFVNTSFAETLGRRKWRYRVAAKRFQSAKLSLEAGITRRGSAGIELPPVALSNDWFVEFEGSGDSEADAFSALGRVYSGLFRQPLDAIPFQKENRLSVESFLEAMGEQQ